MAPPPFLNLLSNHDEKCSFENLLLNDGTARSKILTTPLCNIFWDTSHHDCLEQGDKMDFKHFKPFFA